MRSARTSIIVLSALLSWNVPAYCQAAGAGSNVSASDQASAYFNFSMGHYYRELAEAYGKRGDYYNKAVDYYKQAVKLDPSTTFILEELTDLYVQGNQLKAAITEAEELLRQNPDNLQARRMLGHIYTSMIGDTQQGKINEEMVKKSIEQYTIITGKDPTDIESWLTLGRLQRVAQNSVEAEKAFKQALGIDADSEDALIGLSLVYSDVGDSKNMIEMLKRVTGKSPNPQSLAMLGNAYQETRDYASAAEVFAKALELKPDNIQIKKALAFNLFYAERLDEALKRYKEVEEEDPKDPVAPLRLSEIYRAKKMYDQAHAELAKAKELDKDSLEVRFVEVNLLESEGKAPEAIKLLSSILDETAKKSYTTDEKRARTMFLEGLANLYRTAHQFPKAVETLRQIGTVDPDAGPQVAKAVIATYVAAKDLPAALAEAESALKKYPKNRIVQLAHADVLADTGKVDQAAAEVKGLLHGENDRETYLSLADVYEKGKNFTEMEKALGEAEKLAESKQDKESIYFMRGAMFEKMKKYSASETEFRKVIDLNPKNSGALNYLGYMLADRGERLEEAKDMIRKALDLDPDNAAYLDSMGWVYFRLNRLDEAEKLLRQAVEKINGDPTVYDHLGDVFLKEGKVKDAIAQWQMSLKEYEKSPQSEQDPDEVAKVTKKLEGARVRLASESSGGAKQR